jgi:hypothetical protein
MVHSHEGGGIQAPAQSQAAGVPRGKASHRNVMMSLFQLPPQSFIIVPISLEGAHFAEVEKRGLKVSQKLQMKICIFRAPSTTLPGTRSPRFPV